MIERLLSIFQRPKERSLKPTIIWAKIPNARHETVTCSNALFYNDLRISSHCITKLGVNEVFVFGSNISGIHDGGASEMAAERFGAIIGQAEGPQGSSYAIPTDGCSLAEIQKAVDRFILYAKAHPNIRFLVTEIGCGTAGFHPMEIAPLLKDACSIHNIYLPIQFWKHIK